MLAAVEYYLTSFYAARKVRALTYIKLPELRSRQFGSPEDLCACHSPFKSDKFL
jgi:hypothetical protein